MTTPTPDKQTPDLLTDLIAAWLSRDVRFLGWATTRRERLAEDLAAVIRAAQDEDSGTRRADERDAAARAWIDEGPLRRDRRISARWAFEQAWDIATARADLAAHHDTRPEREQIAKVVTRTFWDFIPDDTVRAAITAAGYEAADAVLALLGPARTVDRKPDEGRHHNARP